MASSESIIALDAMGGDFAPKEAVIAGVLAARKSQKIVLVGDEQVIRNHIELIEPEWRKLPIKLLHASEKIDMDEEPAKAVHRKKDSSISVAMREMKLGKVDAVVSAGSTGAVLVSSIVSLGRENGIFRPALAGLVPTDKDRVICLDLGANVDCDPSHLLQFARLGVREARRLLSIENPRVGLLSNGSEACKGNSVTRETFSILDGADDVNFVGNVEPGDIVEQRADVLVMDGFTGNVMIKAFEAIVGSGVESIRHSAEERGGYCDKCKVVFEKCLHKLSNGIGVGAGFLVGVNGCVVVAHGKSCSGDIVKSIDAASWYLARVRAGDQVSSQVCFQV